MEGMELKSLALVEGMRALEEEQMLWKPGVQVREAVIREKKDFL